MSGDLGWTNVKGISDAPDQVVQMKLPASAASGKGFKGKYFIIQLKAVSPDDTKVTAPYIATVSILGKNDSAPQQATVKFDASSYDVNKGGSTTVTVQRADGEGVVWLSVVAYPAAADGSPASNPNTADCWWTNSYSTGPGDNVAIEVRASVDSSPSDGLVFHLPPSGSTIDASGDLVYYLDLSVLDDKLAKAGDTWRARVTMHSGNTTVTPVKVNSTRVVGSLSSGGSTINQDINTMTAQGPENPGSDVRQNPQPEPPKPVGFLDGFLNSIKSLFGLH